MAAEDAEIDNLLDDFARGEVFNPPDPRERFQALLHEGNADRLNTDELIALYQWYIDLLKQQRTCSACNQKYTEVENIGSRACLFHHGEFSTVQKAWSCCNAPQYITGCRRCDHYETQRMFTPVVRVPAFLLSLFVRKPQGCATQQVPFLCMENDIDERMQADEVEFLAGKSVCVTRAEMY
jgi:hypothetical protein